MKLFFIFLLILNSSLTHCQVDIKKSYQDEFDSYKNNITHEFNTFKKQNDSLFLKFLDDSWHEFRLFKSERKPKPKPVEQPKVSTGDAPEKNKIENAPKNNNSGGEPDRSVKGPGQMPPPGKIDFYGTLIDKPTDEVSVPTSDNVTKDSIHAFFELISENDNTNQYISYLHREAEKLELNDWGFISLLKKTAASLFVNRNKQKLFIWYALLINAYDVRAGFDGKRVYLLINTDYKLFNTSYFTLNQQRYYIFRFEDDPEDVSLIFAHQAKYVDEPGKVSLSIIETPKLERKTITKHFTFRGAIYPVKLNQNLIDFYNSYPETDLPVYFSTPLSAEASLSMTNFLNPILKGKTGRQKVDILLEYIQYSIKYKTDEKQFGKERYLFAEETLFYPYADCEDRVALLAQLVKQFTGLSAIGIDYPQHVSLAVAFPEKPDGYNVTFMGRKYYICDPTYIGAKSGICMDDFKNVTPNIIYYGQ